MLSALEIVFNIWYGPNLEWCHLVPASILIDIYWQKHSVCKGQGVTNFEKKSHHMHQTILLLEQKKHSGTVWQILPI